MDNFTVLVEARPFGVFDSTPMENLKTSDMRVIDLRGSRIKVHIFIMLSNRSMLSIRKHSALCFEA